MTVSYTPSKSVLLTQGHLCFVFYDFNPVRIRIKYIGSTVERSPSYKITSEEFPVDVINDLYRDLESADSTNNLTIDILAETIQRHLEPHKIKA